MPEVKINVKNVHFASIVETTGAITYGTPELVAGAMEIVRTPTVATGQLYGDGKVSRSTSKKVAYQIQLQHNRIPAKWRRIMEGTTLTTGVESGTSSDVPAPVAIGWEVEKTNGESELIWFLYCKATPIEERVQQSQENITYSTDTLTLTALEHDLLERYYTMIDTEEAAVTEDMVEDFFTQVQTSNTIAAPIP